MSAPESRQRCLRPGVQAPELDVVTENFIFRASFNDAARWSSCHGR